MLDEVDSGALIALRGYRGTLDSVCAYRLAAVLVAPTVYVVAATSFSGLPKTGLVPIGLLAGLSALVTLPLTHRLGQQEDSRFGNVVCA